MLYSLTVFSRGKSGEPQRQRVYKVGVLFEENRDVPTKMKLRATEGATE